MSDYNEPYSKFRDTSDDQAMRDIAKRDECRKYANRSQGATGLPGVALGPNDGAEINRRIAFIQAHVKGATVRDCLDAIREDAQKCVSWHGDAAGDAVNEDRGIGDFGEPGNAHADKSWYGDGKTPKDPLASWSSDAAKARAMTAAVEIARGGADLIATFRVPSQERVRRATVVTQRAPGTLWSEAMRQVIADDARQIALRGGPKAPASTMRAPDAGAVNALVTARAQVLFASGAEVSIGDATRRAARELVGAR